MAALGLVCILLGILPTYVIPALDRAVPWAHLNLDAALACNPDLGCGLVAGYGPGGPTGYRPGFGWYFGGDAAINSLAMSSAPTRRSPRRRISARERPVCSARRSSSSRSGRAR